MQANLSCIHTPQGLRLVYESIGQRHHPAVILIMGLGAQMQIWPDELCQGLADAGYYVIRFDNRDAGRSSKLHHQIAPGLIRTLLSQTLNRPVEVPYTLQDMSDDVLALMDALDIDNAHIIGASMGGMIAQIVAAKAKKRVRSLTSIMSSPHHPLMAGRNLPLLLQLLLRPASDDHEQNIRYIMRMNQLIGSPAYPLKEQELRQLAETSQRYATGPQAFKRQLLAITSCQSRQALLAKIKVPSLVIHGADDPLIPPHHGQQTALAIRKAKLRIIQGMGHDLPPALIPKLQKLMIKHLRKGDKKWLKRQLKQLPPQTLMQTDNYLNSQPNGR